MRREDNLREPDELMPSEMYAHNTDLDSLEHDEWQLIFGYGPRSAWA
jgi:hypothetical protein